MKFPEDTHHSVRVPEEVFIVVAVGDELFRAFMLLRQSGSENGVYRKARIAFVVPKNAILEELIGQFDPSLRRLFRFQLHRRMDCKQCQPTRDLG